MDVTELWKKIQHVSSSYSCNFPGKKWAKEALTGPKESTLPSGWEEATDKANRTSEVLVCLWQSWAPGTSTGPFTQAWDGK